MSWLLLIDGYNVVAPVTGPSGGLHTDRRRRSDQNWLRRERNLLIHRLAEGLNAAIRQRTMVVFDAADPPPDRPNRMEMAGITIEYAVNHREADDLLEEIIVAHSAPKTLAVVSSDHRVQTAARRRGSTAYDSQPWLDALLDGRIHLAPESQHRVGQRSTTVSEKPESIDDDDVQQWMRDFGF